MHFGSIKNKLNQFYIKMYFGNFLYEITIIWSDIDIVTWNETSIIVTKREGAQIDKFYQRRDTARFNMPVVNHLMCSIQFFCRLKIKCHFTASLKVVIINIHDLRIFICTYVHMRLFNEKWKRSLLFPSTNGWSHHIW